MAQTEQQITGKAAAAAAAKKMLEQRIALVTKLGDAIDNHRRTGDAVTAAKTAQQDAAEAVRTAHSEALAGGWTATELRNAGLISPTGPRRKRTTTKDQTPTAGHAPSQPAHE